MRTYSIIISGRANYNHFYNFFKTKRLKFTIFVKIAKIKKRFFIYILCKES